MVDAGHVITVAGSDWWLVAHLVSRLRMAEKAPGLISERSRATQPGPTASCNNTGDRRREKLAINEEYLRGSFPRYVRSIRDE